MAESGWAGDISVADIIDKLAQLVLLKYDALEITENTPSFQDGDLGIGYALLRAGQVFHNAIFSDKGEQILERCAYVFLDKNKWVPDSGMLNGASGGGLVFEKAYRLTGNDLFNQTAESCF